MTSGTALQRIRLVESSYVKLANATRAAIAAGHVSQNDALVRQIILLGQEIADWKPGATALAYKSPWDAAREANEKLRLVHRTGAQLARRTGKRNPAINPAPYAPPESSVWPWVMLAAIAVGGIVAWKVL